MASSRVRTVTQQLSSADLTKGGANALIAFVEREVKPMLRQVREAINEFMPAPVIPIFDSSPVTDADFIAIKITPKNGLLSYSSADGLLYIRNGSSTHTAL